MTLGRNTLLARTPDMDDPSSTKRETHWTATLRLGSHTFPAALLLALIATAAVFALRDPLSLVFGTGAFALFVIVLLLFFVLLAFKRLLFTSIYRDYHGDSDAALLEYIQQTAGTSGEEEMASELIENALHLKEVRAQDCMAPRPEIVHVDVEAAVETLRQRFIESRLSRILVTEDGDLDQVIGYVHVQQLFTQPVSIRSMVMPINFVPESIAVNDLLNKFIRLRTGIAGVVDEYGSLAGLVTLEDALEQLFGDIDDEHDEPEFIETQVGDGEYLFSGRLEIDYLNAKYPSLNLPEGSYNTLSGYLVNAAHTIPEQGARLELNGRTFVLELVSDRKIETVRVVVRG
jgi:CBS domain containing-hemolysin-like protein